MECSRGESGGWLLPSAVFASAALCTVFGAIYLSCAPGAKDGDGEDGENKASDVKSKGREW